MCKPVDLLGGETVEQVVTAGGDQVLLGATAGRVGRIPRTSETPYRPPHSGNRPLQTLRRATSMSALGQKADALTTRAIIFPVFGQWFCGLRLRQACQHGGVLDDAHRHRFVVTADLDLSARQHICRKPRDLADFF